MNRKTETEILVSKKIEENNNGEDRAILLRVDLIDICKDFNAGIMLSQLIYWNDRGNDFNEGWIYKSKTDWYKETRLGNTRVKNGTKKLRELGFIETKNRVAEGHNTRYYKLNLENVLEALGNLYIERNNLRIERNSLRIEPIQSRIESIPLRIETTNYTESIIEYTESTTENTKNQNSLFSKDNVLDNEILDNDYDAKENEIFNPPQDVLLDHNRIPLRIGSIREISSDKKSSSVKSKLLDNQDKYDKEFYRIRDKGMRGEKLEEWEKEHLKGIWGEKNFNVWLDYYQSKGEKEEVKEEIILPKVSTDNEMVKIEKLQKITAKAIREPLELEDIEWFEQISDPKDFPQFLKGYQWKEQLPDKYKLMLVTE